MRRKRAASYARGKRAKTVALAKPKISLAYLRKYAPKEEMKFIDVSLTDATLSGAMTLFNLCTVPQGDTESQRVGRKITIKSVSIRASWQLPAATSAASTSGLVRWRLVNDKQTNGAAFGATDLLETDTYYSFSNLANSSRFKVLRSGTCKLRTSGAAASGAAFVFGEDVKHLEDHSKHNLTIEYDNSITTGAIASVRSNSLWFAVQVAYLNEIVDQAGTIRVRYVDG